MKTVRTIALSMLAIAFVPGTGYAQTNNLEYKPRKVIPVAIRPITNPKIISAAEANIPANALVIGVAHGGESRAYRIDELTGPSREIINDTLGGTAIAATW